jgi:hypothetical protein
VSEPTDFFEQALDPRRCFLCGARVQAGTRSKEHVFAQWLLDRHQLRRQQLTLLNGTLIGYDQLMITACVACNTGPLSRLESEVGAAFARGPSAVKAIDPERLFLWLAKFYYGLLFREMTLALDQRDPASQPIVSDEMLRQFGTHHLLLRRLLGQVTWTAFPSSIFVFECLEGDDPKANFDYFDALNQPFVSVRIGTTYVAAFLQDFGAVRQLGVESWEKLTLATQIKLHPLQIIELDSLFYTILMHHRPVKLIIGKASIDWNIMVVPRGGLSGRPPFDDWEVHDYETVLRGMFQMRVNVTLEAPDGGVPSLMRWPDGSPLQAPDLDWQPGVNEGQNPS